LFWTTENAEIPVLIAIKKPELNYLVIK